MNTYHFLSNSDREFLLSYAPKDDMITSSEEVELVEKKLQLGMQKGWLTELRNEVVRYYRDCMGNEIIYEDGKFVSRTAKYWRYNTAMQSVTAVIDHFMIKAGRPDLVF